MGQQRSTKFEVLVELCSTKLPNSIAKLWYRYVVGVLFTFIFLSFASLYLLSCRSA